MWLHLATFAALVTVGLCLADIKSDAEFDKAIAQADATLVVFGASWCRHCTFWRELLLDAESQGLPGIALAYVECDDEESAILCTYAERLPLVALYTGCSVFSYTAAAALPDVLQFIVSRKSAQPPREEMCTAPVYALSAVPRLLRSSPHPSSALPDTFITMLQLARIPSLACSIFAVTALYAGENLRDSGQDDGVALSYFGCALCCWIVLGFMIGILPATVCVTLMVWSAVYLGYTDSSE